MNNMNTNKWKQSGRLYLWRYEDNPKNYCGWHLTADSEGVRSLLELIGLMLKSKDESYRTIKLYQTTGHELRVPNCRSRAISCSKLILKNKKDNEDNWNISDQQGIATIVAGDDSLSNLMAGLLDIQRGRGDYFIGTNGHELWFWWYIEVP